VAASLPEKFLFSHILPRTQRRHPDKAISDSSQRWVNHPKSIGARTKLTPLLAPVSSMLQVRLAVDVDVAAEADVAVDEGEAGEAAQVLGISQHLHPKHRIKSIHILSRRRQIGENNSGPRRNKLLLRMDTIQANTRTLRSTLHANFLQI
jgi:hypothetical protein